MLITRIVQLFTLALLCLPFWGNAQVTTSSVTGTVKTQKGELLEGATIVATHLPSGTVYTTTAKKGGTVNLPAMRIGGPYQIKITYVGYDAETINDVYLALGEPYNFTSSLKDEASTIAAVTVTAASRRRVLSDKTGMSTVIGQRQITTAPTISRSITDLTRLTPQSNGTNFAGRDGHYNNMVVDGANLNNNFGISADLLPGGGNPISLDAFDEISVNIAPFDVRQSAFTGAGINAVTKSGTNTFKGSAYGYYRDQSFNGTKVKETDLGTLTPNKNKIYGGTLGGPIIKNKLFFFVSAELEESERPPTAVFKPTGGSASGSQSAVSIDSLSKLSNYLSSAFGYDAGGYDGVPNLKTKNRKILAKIDWNINKTHKLTLKYSDYDNNNDVQLNASSISFAGGATFTVRNGASTASLSQLPNNRISANSLSYGNSNYAFHDVVRSGALELNSNFSGKFSNQFLATLTKIQDTRTIPGQLFPFIDILNNDAKNYMSVGTDPFSNNNDVVNDVYNVTDNFTYFAGKHTVTAGASYEYQRVGNMFMGASQSYYLFNSLNDFVTNQAPAGYSLTYSLVPGKPAVYSAELKLGQLGLYIQDEINVNENLKITAGLRLDKPIYTEDALENPMITALNLPNKDGEITNYNTGQWPKSTWYFSPRVGFRWNANADRTLVIRGGTGIFTGKLPFVWLTNMPSNSAMYQSNQTVTNLTSLQNYKFNPNPTAYEANFPHTAGTFTPVSFVVIDPEFKFPQVWRTNFAFDQRFGTGWSFTGEVLFTKDLNSIVMRNANEKPTDGTLTGSPDTRPRFTTPTNAGRRIYANVSQAIVLENTSKGYSGTFTAAISKTAAKGFYGSLAYNYTIASEVSANPGSTAASVWSGNFNKGTQNSIELYNSQYVIPHRIIGNISYRVEYLKHLATTIGIYYEGAKQSNFSFIYSNDLNGDGNSSDLLYIPKDPSEITFVNRTASGTTTARTAKEQSDAFFAFIDNDPYLKKHKGQYAERNSAYLPWYTRVDAKVLQDIFTNIGGHRNTIQFSLDIVNVANLLNKDWGIRQQVTYRNPLTVAAVDAAGKPTYYMNQLGGQLPTSAITDIVSSNTTWGLQIGVRYIF